jgi:hypothetical protein
LKGRRDNLNRIWSVDVRHRLGTELLVLHLCCCSTLHFPFSTDRSFFHPAFTRLGQASRLKSAVCASLVPVFLSCGARLFYFEPVAGTQYLGVSMSELETFAVIGIVTALAAVIVIPEVSRVAPLSVINIFGMVTGLLVTSMGFLAFNTNWYEQGAWRSGVLIVTGSLIACYMVDHCVKHNRPLG